MKTISVIAFVLLVPANLHAQPGIPRDVEFALLRIEHAFQTGSPTSIEDLFPLATTMRLGDSLYWNVSSITALDLLKRYFDVKKEILFRFESPGSGTLIYSSAGRRDTVSVDVWLSRSRREVSLYALNFSNYPLATIFMDIHRSRR
jgi:hypothetical protein